MSRIASKIAPLLISRAVAARLLGGVHVSKLARLEATGVLDPIRLDPGSPTSPVFYKTSQIAVVARCEPEEVLRQLQSHQQLTDDDTTVAERVERKQYPAPIERKRLKGRIKRGVNKTVGR